MRAGARRMTEFGEGCAEQGMPLAYHHHMAAAVETEEELDLFMANSGEGIPLLYDAGHMAMAGGGAASSGRTPARASRSFMTRGKWPWPGRTCCGSSTSTTRASPTSIPRTC